MLVYVFALDNLSAGYCKIVIHSRVAIGLAILECPEAAEDISDGDEVKINFDTGLITNETKNKTYQAEPFPEFIKNMIKDGGLMASLKKEKK